MTDSNNLPTRGRHRALARSVGFDRTGVDKKETVVVGFDFTDQNDTDYGRGITAFLYLTDLTFDRTIESLRHCGWEGDELAELPDLAASGGLNQEVELVVDHEEWDGKLRAKVKWVNRIGGGAVQLKNPLDGAELASFSARMKGRIRTVGTGGAGGSRRTAAGGGGGHGSGRANAPGDRNVPPPDDSDIPF